jgi:hypothetical protein
VLRARDVIPPFDKMVPPVGQGGTDVEPSQIPPAEASGNGGKTERGFVAHADERIPALPDREAQIPAYNLAENILAEQRRAAGRRRSGPGRMKDKPMAPSPRVGARVFLPEPTPQDLLELQRIVAEIVARDIARLCKRPDRLFVARASCP